MKVSGRRRQQRSVHALGRPIAWRHLRQAHDRPDRCASPAQELSCQGRNRCRVRARPAGAPPNPTAPSLARPPHDPFARTGRSTPAWRRCSKIQSAPRSLSRPAGLPSWSPWIIKIDYALFWRRGRMRLRGRPPKCIAALGGNRFDQARVIIPDVADPQAYRPASHLLRGKRLE